MVKIQSRMVRITSRLPEGSGRALVEGWGGAGRALRPLGLRPPPSVSYGDGSLRLRPTSPTP